MRGALRTLGRAAGIGAACAAVAGTGYVALTWYRYGRFGRTGPPDPLLDRFMPVYEVRERHQIRVAASLATTYAAVRAMDLERSRLVRAIFRGREILMRAEPTPAAARGPLLQVTRALGWRELGEVPGREIAMGAVTRPWEANVVFRGLPPDEFAVFAEPGYVKIAWTLAAAPDGPSGSLAITETRVATTDAYARERFRKYWSLASPGILLIRRLGLRVVKEEAERSR